jgi:very-short-patch-repair endonuclease
VIELDGGKFHSTGWQRRRDDHRDDLLLAHGYVGGRITDAELAERPAQAVEKARAMLAASPTQPP